MSEVLILRHGQTEWNLARRYQGAMDSPLTALGVQQAKAQGRILASHIGSPLIYQILSSPQPRAARTADLALAALGRVAQPDSRLREISIGQWEGLRFEDIFGPEGPDDDTIWWMDSAPGGEGHVAVAARVADLLAEAPRPVILVTHGVTACHLRGQLLGLSLQDTVSLACEQGVVYRIHQGQEVVLRDVKTQLANRPDRS